MVHVGVGDELAEQLAPRDGVDHFFAQPPLPQQAPSGVTPAPHAAHPLGIERLKGNDPAPPVLPHPIEPFNFQEETACGLHQLGACRALSVTLQRQQSDVLAREQIGQALSDSAVSRGGENFTITCVGPGLLVAKNFGCSPAADEPGIPADNTSAASCGYRSDRASTADAVRRILRVGDVQAKCVVPNDEIPRAGSNRSE